MYNQDVLDLYPRVPVGTKVTVTWDRFTSVAGYSPPAGKSSGYSSASSSNPTGSGGGFFSLSGDDDQPPEKPRRPVRSKHPRSASTE